ncbi:Protein kinase domain containing protein [Entamoeba marina]
MSIHSLPSLSYDDYFWYDIVYNKKINHVSEPFFEYEYKFKDDYDYYVSLRFADSKYDTYFPSPHPSKKSEDSLPVLFTNIEGIDIDEFESVRELLLSEELNQMGNILKVYEAVLGVCNDSNDNLSNCFWIVCQLCYSKLLNNYLGNGKLHSDEIKFMTYDLLKIAQEVIELNEPCVIDEKTVMLVKDPASPFPKLMLSPLAFVLGVMNESNKQKNEDPLIQVSNLIEKLGEVDENIDLIKHLKNNQSIKDIMKTGVVRDIKYLVNGPVCSIHNYSKKMILGNGTYGVVWKATDSNGTIVSIKEGMDNCDSLKREAIIMRLCDHENIVKFITLATEESIKSSIENSCNTQQLESVGVVMEYCDGDLESYLNDYTRNNESCLPYEEIGNIFYQIASAQHYLHFEKKIIHRDIKLDNYLIKKTPQLTVKCCDFGFARSSADDIFKTKAGAPIFASREIIMGESYSEKSDLYSIGICLFYLATSNLPFTYDDYESKMQKKEPITFPIIFQIDKDYKLLIDLVKKLTDYDEEKRISWEEFYEHPYMKQIKPH